MGMERSSLLNAFLFTDCRDNCNSSSSDYKEQIHYLESFRWRHCGRSKAPLKIECGLLLVGVFAAHGTRHGAETLV